MSASLDLQTLTGLKVDQMYAKLDEQLPPDAYKPIAGTHGKNGDELTDIDPNYATEVLNQVFGLRTISDNVSRRAIKIVQMGKRSGFELSFTISMLLTLTTT